MFASSYSFFVLAKTLCISPLPHTYTHKRNHHQQHTPRHHTNHSPLAENETSPAKRAANLRLTECGSATPGESFSSCPSSVGAALEVRYTLLNNYCKSNYHLQNRLLLFIQTWSARWAGARLGIVVTADQWHARNREGTDLQTRGPMETPVSNWVGFCYPSLVVW